MIHQVHPKLFLLILIIVSGQVSPVRSEEQARKTNQDLEADICIYGATPAGIACAVRAAREGLQVLLVNRTEHIGGMLSGGLGVWDTVWEGKRSPVYDELRESIFEYYRTTYGEDSSQYRNSLPGKSGHSNGMFEPGVVEKLIEKMVQAESNIRVLTGYIPVSVERNKRIVESIEFQEFHGTKKFKATASVFVDCTYEGDLLPLTGVSYLVGRESQSEYDEPHAGRIYMASSRQRPEGISDERWMHHEELDLRKFPGFQKIVEYDRTGEGDNHVQAMNYRTILSSDPENRLPVNKPDDYNPERVKDLEYGSFVYPIPNQKICWNRPQLVGLHNEYIESDWEKRQEVMDAHWQATLSLLYYLQNDPSVPESKQKFWRQYGLARDEFTDHGNRPYEIYVREARRLKGRYILTQHDLMPAENSIRPPVHSDSIAITDWYIDSHAVTGGKIGKSLDEGKMMLHAETWPGQIPWRCLLPEEVDNLLVPVCLSSSHIAWCAIRLEPTWMQTGEAAGFACVMAIRKKVPPAKLNPEELIIKLVKNQMLLTFFNGLDQIEASSEKEAYQYFGTQGYFADYNIHLSAAEKQKLLKEWKAFSERD